MYNKENTQEAEEILDLARFLYDYSSDDLRVQSSGDMSGGFLQ